MANTLSPVLATKFREWVADRIQDVFPEETNRKKTQSVAWDQLSTDSELDSLSQRLGLRRSRSERSFGSRASERKSVIDKHRRERTKSAS